MSDEVPLLPAGYTLREIQLSDASSVADLFFDPIVMKYLNGGPKKTKVDWVKAFTIGSYQEWAILSSAGRVIGVASFIDVMPTPDREIRVLIAQEHWNRGLGKATTEFLVNRAFVEMNADSVIATVHPDNQASLKMLERLAFRRICRKESSGFEWQSGHLRYQRNRNACGL